MRIRSPRINPAAVEWVWDVPMKSIWMFVLTLLTLVSSSGARATAVQFTLDDLVLGESILAGDKEFSNWFAIGEYQDTGGDLLDFFDLSTVTVTGLEDDPDNPGLRFDFTQDSGSVAGGNSFLLDISYTVSVLDPDKRVKSASSELIGASVIGDGSVAIEEFVFDDVFEPAADLIFVTADPILGDILFDSAPVDPPGQELNIDNFIDVVSFDDSSTASLFSFEQRFMQGPATVPEPGTLLMLGLGVVIVGFQRSRFGGVAQRLV